MKIALLTSLGMAAALWAASTAAQVPDFPGDPDAGRAYAEEVCSGCHRLGGWRWGTDRTAASFADIAAKPEITGMALLAWLTSTPHPTMPDLIIPPEKARDVTAYILSLKRR